MDFFLNYNNFGENPRYVEMQRLKIVREAKIVLSSEEPQQIRDLIDTNILLMLVECLHCHEQPILQYEALLALGFLAAGTPEEMKHLINSGAVPSFIMLLLSPYVEVRQQSLHTLSNIMADGERSLKHVLQEGFLGPFLSLLKDCVPESLLKELIYHILFELCANFKYVRSFDVNGKISSTIHWLLNHTEEEFITNALKAIAILTKGKECQIKMVIDSGFIPKLISLFEYPENKIKGLSLRVLGNILLKSNEQVQCVLDHQVVAYLPALLSNSEEKIRRNAAFFLQLYLESGGMIQVQEVIDAGLLPTIINDMQNSEISVQRRVLCIIYFFIVGSNEYQLLELIGQGVVSHICRMLSLKDQGIISTALINLKTILKNLPTHRQELIEIIEECCGDKKIEELTNYDDEEISDLAKEILYIFM